MDLPVGLRYLLNRDPLFEGITAFLLLAYVLGVVYGTKFLYNYMRKRGASHSVAVYYNRKLIHIFAGGVVALLVPKVFTGAAIPLALSILLAFITYLPHRGGKLMYWFQVEENMYEVNFCLMWGLTLTLAWILLGNPLYGIVPIVFMAFGDAVTGIVRNAVFGRRTKHWLGNLAMLAVSLPAGVFMAGLVGGLAAAVASFIERFELKPIDDNVLISLCSLAVLLLGGAAGML